MKYPRTIILLAAIAAAAPLFAAEPAENQAAVLRVGVAPVSPPMIYKEGGKIVGVEADFANALGRDLGRPVKFVEMDWEELIDALNDNKIDIIMSAMSITRARQYRVAFSEPYLRVGQMALVRADDRLRYSFFSNPLLKETIGVKKGTTADLLVQQEYPRSKRKYYKSGDEAAKALIRGKINLFVNDSTMIWYLAGMHEADGLVVVPTLLTEESLAWGLRRSDDALRTSVNGFLKKSMGNGEVQRVLHRWIPRMQ